MNQNRFRIKGSDRIQINNLLSAICIGILTILLTVSKYKISQWILVQLSCAIPSLIISSLSYAKITYRDSNEIKIWDSFGWLLHIIGYILITNSILLLLYQTNNRISFWVFFIFNWLCYLIYSLIDIFKNKGHICEKFCKIYLFSLLIFIGSFIPVILHLI